MVRTVPKNVNLPWDKEQLQNVFKSFDKDGDGKLSWDELKQAFTHLGSRWSYYRTNKAFGKADYNKDGFINQEELAELVDYALDCGYKVN